MRHDLSGRTSAASRLFVPIELGGLPQPRLADAPAERIVLGGPSLAVDFRPHQQVLRIVLVCRQAARPRPRSDVIAVVVGERCAVGRGQAIALDQLNTVQTRHSKQIAG
jgi:hypothetical protein